VARIGKRTGAYGVLEGKRPFERPMRTREENIKKDHQEIGWSGKTLNGLIWLRIGTSDGLFHAQ